MTITGKRTTAPAYPDEEKVRKWSSAFTAATPAGARLASGLGLSLVASVVKLHGGSLTLSDANPGLRASLLDVATDGRLECDL